MVFHQRLEPGIVTTRPHQIPQDTTELLECQNCVVPFLILTMKASDVVRSFIFKKMSKNLRIMSRFAEDSTRVSTICFPIGPFMTLPSSMERSMIIISFWSFMNSFSNSSCSGSCKSNKIELYDIFYPLRDIISYALLESAIGPDIQPKSSRSHKVEPSGIWMTEGTIYHMLFHAKQLQLLWIQ